MCGRLFMSVASFGNPRETYHREDTNFDFKKWQNNELKVTHEPGDVYVCNQTCFADWMMLLYQFSPVFTKIVYVETEDSRKEGP